MAGGFPLELPAMSIAEPFQKPSPLLYRNLLAMEADAGRDFDVVVRPGRIDEPEIH